jgi:hypothetical protein
MRSKHTRALAFSTLLSAYLRPYALGWAYSVNASIA